MEINELDKRLRTLEMAQSGIDQTFKQIATDLHDIKKDLRTFLETKPKLDNVDVLMAKYDGLIDRIQSMEITQKGILKDVEEVSTTIDKFVITVNNLVQTVNTMSTEHNACKRVQETGVNFILGRAGTVVDWVFKLVILSALAYYIKSGGH